MRTRGPARFWRIMTLAALTAWPAAAQSEADLGTLWDGRRTSKDTAVTFKAQTAPPPAVQGVPVGQSDWTSTDPDDAGSETNPSSPEKSRFWESLQNSVLDACRHIDLTVDQEQEVGGLASVGGRLSRSIMRYPTGRLALLDEFSPKLAVGFTPTVFRTDNGLTGSVSVGAQLQGQSLVVRPAKSASSCKELLKLANPISYKTVLPIKAKRFTEMEVGELWKMAVAYRFGFQPAVGASYQGVSVTLYWGRFHSNAENVSLFRMSEDKLRLRFRVDRADIESLGGGIGGTVTAAQLGLQVADDLLARQLGRTLSGPIDHALNAAIAHEISRYLRAALEVSIGKRQGEQSVLEFILDPGNEAQMKALADLLKGDFFSLKALAKLVLPVELPQIVDERGRLEKWAGNDREKLGDKETFAGTDRYDRRSKGLHLMIPILWHHQASWSKNEENIVLLDSQGSRINVWETERRKSNKFIEIPLLGHLTLHEKWRSGQTFTSRGQDGTGRTPAVLYVQQEGFHRESAASARDMTRRADEVMRYVGAHGNGINQRTQIPVDSLFPQPPPPPPDSSRPGQDQTPAEPTYRSAVMALTLVFNQKAVQDILHATAEEVVRAYANALDASERTMLAQVLGLPKTAIGQDGKIKYDLYPLTKGMDRQQQDGWRSSVSSLAYTATRIVQDLAQAAQAPDPEAQAKEFSRILSGSGKSGLAYEDILKVLVQLIDPLDLSAEFYAQTNKRVEGEEDVRVRYILNDRRISADKLLSQMLDARRRFVEPSKITD